MLLVPSIGSGSLGRVELTYLSRADDNGSSSGNWTAATGTSFGAVDTTRRIIVCCAAERGDGNPDVGSVTIGGIAATKVIDLSSGSYTNAEMWQALVPTGLTGNIVINWTNDWDSGFAAWWRLTGANIATQATASDSSYTTNALSATLTIPSGGAALGYHHDSTGSSRTVTWTNMESEDFDVRHASTSDDGTSAARSIVSGTATRTATLSSTSGDGQLLLASWGP